jgi:Rrf2 family transcriptional regulator, nitric oxide-sensitive transcriptional repressor
MRLTQFTDYSLRVLIYLGVKPDGFATISEIAEKYGISRNHVMKVVYQLGQLGYLKTVRGKGGGVRLGQPPEDINLGRLVRKTEPDMRIVECFGPDNTCCLDPACGMKGILASALRAFLETLDKHTLADVIRNEQELQRMLGHPSVA